MKVTVIPVVISALGTILKSLEWRLEELEIGRQAKTIHSTVLLKSAEKSPEDLRRLDVIQIPVVA